MASDESVMLTEFTFEHRALRAIVHHGEPWFVVRDVCAILGLTNPTAATADLSDHERRVGYFLTRGRPQKLGVVNEDGFYRLIFRNSTPAAKRFSGWVIRELLPALHKIMLDQRFTDGQNATVHEIDV
jgi:prophage antirepressor-like protein